MLPPELELPLLEPEFCSLSVSMVTGSWELRLGSTPDLNRKIWKLSQARERAKLYFTALHSFFFYSNIPVPGFFHSFATSKGAGDAQS